MDDEKPKRKARKKAEADGNGGRKRNWKEYTATVEEIKAFLNDHVYLRYNVISRRVECRIPASDLFLASDEHGRTRDMDFRDSPCLSEAIENSGWQPVTDRIVNSLWAEMSKEKTVRVQDVYRVIESDFVHEYHPFRFYLDHLPPWNGENHILSMSVSVSVKGDVDVQMRFAEYLTKWLVGMVAGWVDDSVVNNVILVLIGEQGSYKTTWFNYLLPPELRSYFYTKTNANRMGRDDLLTLAQYGLVCCEELDTMRPSELNQLKAAVTMPSIDERGLCPLPRAPQAHRLVLWHGQQRTVPLGSHGQPPLAALRGGEHRVAQGSSLRLRGNLRAGLRPLSGGLPVLVLA